MRLTTLLVALPVVMAACASPMPSRTATVPSPTPGSSGEQTSMPTPLPTPTGALAALPSAGGTCTANQLVAVEVTKFGPGYGGPSMYVTQPLRNIGRDCVLELPAAIAVAASDGTFQAVSVIDAGTTSASGDNTPAMSASVASGATVSVVIGAWWDGVAPAPCASQIFDVTRVEFPLAEGTLQIDLPAALKKVCPTPATMSLSIQAT